MLTPIMEILLLGALGGPSLAPPADRADIRHAERIEGLKGLSDVALVAPGLYRGGTPREGGMDALSKLGVRTIVNLRHFHKRSEGALAEKAGIKLIWRQFGPLRFFAVNQKQILRHRSLQERIWASSPTPQ